MEKESVLKAEEALLEYFDFIFIFKFYLKFSMKVTIKICRENINRFRTYMPIIRAQQWTFHL